MKRNSTVKMSILYTLTYKFNTIPNMISGGFSAGESDMLTTFRKVKT